MIPQSQRYPSGGVADSVAAESVAIVIVSLAATEYT